MALIERYLRDVPDFPKPGIIFKDITPLLQDAEGLRTSIRLLEEAVDPAGYDLAARQGVGLGVGVVRLVGVGRRVRECRGHSRGDGRSEGWLQLKEGVSDSGSMRSFPSITGG